MTVTPKEKSSAIDNEAKRLSDWQNKLIWWMVITPSVLILLFISMATLQVNRFNQEIDSYQKSELEPIHLAASDPQHASWNNQADYVRFYTLAKMEEMAMRKRYSQAGVLLMSRVLTKYLGFFTGMILAIVGAVFIIAKLREERSKIAVNLKEGIGGTLGSSSPGIIFGVLGTILMLATILQHAEVNVKDMPLYLNAGNLMSPTTISNQQAKVPVVDSVAVANLDTTGRPSANEMSDSAMRNARPE